MIYAAHNSPLVHGWPGNKARRHTQLPLHITSITSMYTCLLAKYNVTITVKPLNKWLLLCCHRITVRGHACNVLSHVNTQIDYNSNPQKNVLLWFVHTSLMWFRVHTGLQFFFRLIWIFKKRLKLFPHLVPSTALLSYIFITSKNVKRLFFSDYLHFYFFSFSYRNSKICFLNSLNYSFAICVFAWLRDDETWQNALNKSHH